MQAIHKPPWESRGWMTFTVVDSGLLHLGGVSQTAPTLHISAGVSDATGFLAGGIPQHFGKTAFADKAQGDNGTGHTIKHAIIRIYSAGANAPAGRFLDDGSTPTSSLGEPVDISDPIIYEDNRSAIFNFKLINLSGGNMVVTVRPYE